MTRCWASLWADGQEPTCQCWGHGFDPWSGKTQPAVGQRRLWATTAEPVLGNRGHWGKEPARQIWRAALPGCA